MKSQFGSLAKGKQMPTSHRVTNECINKNSAKKITNKKRKKKFRRTIIKKTKLDQRQTSEGGSDVSHFRNLRTSFNSKNDYEQFVLLISLVNN